MTSLSYLLRRLIVTLGIVLTALRPAAADDDPKPSIRGVVPRAQTAVAIDGQLKEYDKAFCTPLEYFNPNPKNRPAQFFCLWDDEALYVGVRTLDEHAFTPAEQFWTGDAVEWYLDTRRDDSFLSRNWSQGAVHCFFSGVRLDKLEPRFLLRPGQEGAIPKTGVQVASTRTRHGLEYEFKLPWVNFPNFHAAAGQVIGLDAELSYSDGGPRTFRSFVFGGPLSVQQPADLACVELVDVIERRHWKDCGPVLMPIRVDVPWFQQGTPQVEGAIAVPPVGREAVGKIFFEVRSLDEAPIGRYEASEEMVLEPEDAFVMRKARWPLTAAPAGRYQVQAIVLDSQGAELTRVAPRLASVNMEQGY
jgi:hypothetical protein